MSSKFELLSLIKNVMANLFIFSVKHFLVIIIGTRKISCIFNYKLQKIIFMFLHNKLRKSK